MTFFDALRGFQTGCLDGIFHREVGLRLPDKVLLIGPEAVADYLRIHPGFFAELRQISPDSPVTVTFQNGEGHLIKVFATEDRIGKIVEFHPDEIRQRIKLTIEYDGTDFAGFQIQPTGRTVQDELQKVLAIINANPTPVTGASRTDTGVHALGQVVHFDTKYDFSEEKWRMILRHALPADIGVKQVEKVHPLFHARYDVIRKEYRYVLNLGDYSALRRNREWTVDRSINREILAAQLHKITGVHDFAAFCKGTNEDTIRTVFETQIKDSGDRIELTFNGDGFLHNMIRLLVGSLVDIASGKSQGDIGAILKERNRMHTKSLAPAGGLYLVQIDY